MHKADSNVKEEVTNPEYSTSSSNENQTEFTKKKRKIKRTHAGFSKSEEDRILKYALKMSKVEYEQKKQMTFKSFSEINPVLEIKATPQDFINPINFFDKLWKENESSTGIIKIIPPSNWVEFQRGLLNKVYLPRLLDKEKKLYTRKQILNQLYQAKVINNLF